MMRTILLNILLLLSVFLAGCKERPEVVATLQRAESLMESAPDSALTLLQSLDAETFRKRSTRARHALLYTQAQDKNYIDETNDSLINIAADYFRNHGDVRSRFLSLYYKGRTLTNAGDYLNAMLSYAEAEELVDDLHDDYYAGLLYTQLGGLYREYYDFPKSLEAYCKAEACYQRADKELHRLYALSDRLDVCYNMNEYDKCDSIYDRLLAGAGNVGDSVLLEILLGDRVMLSVAQHQMPQAEEAFETLLSGYGVEDKDAHFLARVVELFLSKGDMEQAAHYMKESWFRATSLEDSVDCFVTSSLLHKTYGDYKRAFQDYESGMLLQNRQIRRTLQQPLLTMQRNYLSKELEWQKHRLDKTRVRYGVCWVVTLVMAGAVLVWIYSVSRKRKAENIRMRMAYEELCHDLSHDKTEMSGLIQELFGIHFKMIDRLGEFYHEGNADEKQLDKEICKEVKDFMKGYVDGDAYQELENIVNRYKENVMSLLREEIQLKDEKDYRLVCYHLIGLSAHTISFLMNGMTPENIYQKRTRLKRTIRVSDVPHRDLFMRILNVSDSK